MAGSSTWDRCQRTKLKGLWRPFGWKKRGAESALDTQSDLETTRPIVPEIKEQEPSPIALTKEDTPQPRTVTEAVKEMPRAESTTSLSSKGTSEAGAFMTPTTGDAELPTSTEVTDVEATPHSASHSGEGASSSEQDAATEQPAMEISTPVKPPPIPRRAAARVRVENTSAGPSSPVALIEETVLSTGADAVETPDSAPIADSVAPAQTVGEPTLAETENSIVAPETVNPSTIDTPLPPPQHPNLAGKPPALPARPPPLPPRHPQTPTAGFGGPQTPQPQGEGVSGERT